MTEACNRNSSKSFKVRCSLRYGLMHFEQPLFSESHVRQPRFFTMTLLITFFVRIDSVVQSKGGHLDMEAGTLNVEFPSDNDFKKQQGKHPLVHTLNLNDTPFQIQLLMARIVVTTHGVPSHFQKYHDRCRQQLMQTPFTHLKHLLFLSRTAQLMPRNACMHITILMC